MIGSFLLMTLGLALGIGALVSAALAGEDGADKREGYAYQEEPHVWLFWSLGLAVISAVCLVASGVLLAGAV